MARKRKADTEDSEQTGEESGFSLEPLREHVERARQLVDWMSAAFEHRDQFPPAVVITVVRDYLAQYDEFVGTLKEAATEASRSRKEFAERAASLEDAEKELEAAIDELKLRHVIGELSKEAFAEKEKEVRADAETSELPSIRESIEEIDAALAEVGSVQARIAEMRRNHKDLLGGAAQTSEPEPEVPEDDELGDAAYAAGGSTGTADEEWEVGTAGARAVAAAAAEPADETPAPEEAEAAPAPTPPPAEKQTEDLMATGVISARPDIAAMEEAAKAAPEQLAPTTAEGEGPRLLVVAPDVPEQVYPFTGEVMSMGRGRNNDIQIKNDGKISRYHCRIFRRGDEFIIEDNKSSNGTLVNGKLVTRQRLDGGEQVQIGETRMTFFL